MAMKDKNLRLRKRLVRLLKETGPQNTVVIYTNILTQLSGFETPYLWNPTMSSMTNVLSRHKEFQQTGNTISIQGKNGGSYSVEVWELTGVEGW